MPEALTQLRVAYCAWLAQAAWDRSLASMREQLAAAKHNIDAQHGYSWQDVVWPEQSNMRAPQLAELAVCKFDKLRAWLGADT